MTEVSPRTSGAADPEELEQLRAATRTAQVEAAQAAQTVQAAQAAQAAHATQARAAQAEVQRLQTAKAAEADQLRAQLNAALAERDVLQESTGAAFGEGKPTDVLNLEKELVRVQQELAEAQATQDPHRYEQLANEHMELSRCLMRAVKLRRRS